MYDRNSGLFYFCMLSLFICGAVLFLIGFFPDAYSTVDESIESKEHSRPTNVNGFSVIPNRRKYDQIILMVIDALRFDFMTKNDAIPFTDSKRCNLLKLRVAIPTVTMPRIKSMMTGKLSNFIDIIRNLGEAQKLSDSLIHVLKRQNETINFVGDRTWAELFPTEFTRKKANLDSFFVNDFYQGDLQVVETLMKEINQTDWSLLILHFLGLDHIGHVEGSSSDKIPLKLSEMDKVIQDIVENKHFEKRLLLVTGDHGMRNGGGHGGSTEEELTIPLMFFQRTCNRGKPSTKEYQQIDLTPTLAILFSVEIPKTSIGCLIPELLINLTFEEKLYAFFYNSYHLLNKALSKYGENGIEQKDYLGWYKEATFAHRKFLEAKMQNVSGSFYYEQALANYRRLSNNISSRMAASLVTFNNTLIIVGLFLTSSIAVYSLISLLFTKRKRIGKTTRLSKKRSVISFAAAMIIIILCHNMNLISTETLRMNFLITVIIGVSTYITLGVLKTLLQLLLPLDDISTVRHAWTFPIPIVICYVLSIILLASSSYVELEQLSSHYLGTSCLLFLIVKTVYQRIFQNFSTKGVFQTLNNTTSLLKASLVSLIILRIFRVTDITAEFQYIHWLKGLKDKIPDLFFVLGLIQLMIQLQKLNSIKQRVPSVLALVSVFAFRALEGNMIYISVNKPRFIDSSTVLLLFWICVLIMGLLEFKSYISHNGAIIFLRSFIVSFLLVGALLHKPLNVILLPGLLFTLDKAYFFCDTLLVKIQEPYKQKYKLAYKTFLTIFIGIMFFFYQGNSNSLATIDLNPGYIGQSSYNPIVAAIFLTLNTYSAPIISFFYLTFHILDNKNKHDSTSSMVSSSNEDLQNVLGLYTVASILPAATYLCYMIFFRYHLFIYSVFAPKFFYECYSVIVVYLNYCILYVIIFLLK